MISCLPVTFTLALIGSLTYVFNADFIFALLSSKYPFLFYVYFLIYNGVVFLILWSYWKAVVTEPGFVPKNLVCYHALTHRRKKNEPTCSKKC